MSRLVVWLITGVGAVGAAAAAEFGKKLISRHYAKKSIHRRLKQSSEDETLTDGEKKIIYIHSKYGVAVPIKV